MANNPTNKRPNFSAFDEDVTSGASNKRPRVQNKVETFNTAAQADAPTAMETATNIRMFLELGLLDEVAVICHPSNPKEREKSPSGKIGLIMGSSIYCVTAGCCGNERFSPTCFEKHAGCKKKHPAENFLFYNKNTLKDAMNACKNLPFKSWGVAIRDVLGFVIARRLGTICLSCKGSITKHGRDEVKTVCSLCLQSEESAASVGTWKKPSRIRD